MAKTIQNVEQQCSYDSIPLITFATVAFFKNLNFIYQISLLPEICNDTKGIVMSTYECSAMDFPELLINYVVKYLHSRQNALIIMISNYIPLAKTLRFFNKDFH